MVKRPAIGKRSTATVKSAHAASACVLLASPRLDFAPGDTVSPHRNGWRTGRPWPERRRPRAAADDRPASATSCARRLSGRWTADQPPAVERCVADLVAAAATSAASSSISASVERLDTLGAWVLDRTRHDLGARGHSADFVGARPEHHILLERGRLSRLPAESRGEAQLAVDFLAEVGQAGRAPARISSGGIELPRRGRHRHRCGS